VSSERHRLESEYGQLNARCQELRARMNDIGNRLNEIRWSLYPVGSKVLDNQGVEYEVCGYDKYWPVGYKIKKDGTPSKTKHNIYGLKEALNA